MQAASCTKKMQDRPRINDVFRESISVFPKWWRLCQCVVKSVRCNSAVKTSSLRVSQFALEVASTTRTRVSSALAGTSTGRALGLCSCCIGFFQCLARHESYVCSCLSLPRCKSAAATCNVKQESLHGAWRACFAPDRAQRVAGHNNQDLDMIGTANCQQLCRLPHSCATLPFPTQLR